MVATYGMPVLHGGKEGSREGHCSLPNLHRKPRTPIGPTVHAQAEVYLSHCLLPLGTITPLFLHT